MIQWPGEQPFTCLRTAEITGPGTCNVSEIRTCVHIGTHIDAPSHRIPGGAFLPDIPLEQYWMVPAAVINISAQCAENADYQLSVQDIKAWERKHGRLPEGAWIVVNTGWYKKTFDLTAWHNVGPDGKQHFPGVGNDAAELVVERGSIKGIGIDVTSIDRGVDGDSGLYPVHETLLGAGVLIVENLINLDALPPKGAVLSISPLLVDKASGGPVRVIAALHPDGPEKKGEW